MPHPEYWALIEAQAEGELSPGERGRLEEHLAHCDECTGRMDAAVREVQILRALLAAAEPPNGLTRRILASVPPSRRPPRSMRRAMVAGMIGDGLTALLLLLLSLGAAPLALMIVVALVGAAAWGGLKGLAFGALLSHLPHGMVGRGLLFGAIVWVTTNALVALSAGLGSATSVSPAVLLTGSLLHDLIYGLLVSWLYAHLSTPQRRRAE